LITWLKSGWQLPIHNAASLSLHGVRKAVPPLQRWGSITQRLISLSMLRSGSHPPPRKTRFRLLAGLCRAGLVTRRVSMKGFTFCDDSPFPSFLARCQALSLVFARPNRRETGARVTPAGWVPSVGAFACLMISARSSDSSGDAFRRASSRRVRLRHTVGSRKAQPLRQFA
jgi:hypothetical protein